MAWLEGIFSAGQQWLFEAAVQPLMFALGLGNLLEDGYEATAWFLVGLIQIALLLAVVVPLQRWRPVEPVTDRATIRTDILYTLIHRLGLFRIALFFTLEPLITGLKDKGFCFATLSQHPRYQAWIAQQAAATPPRNAK